MWRFAFVLLLTACAGRPRPVGVAPAAKPHHVQIVHALTTPARRALVEEFRKRNPTSPGTEWSVNEEALATSVTVVDPFAAFLRRARRGERGAPRDATIDVARATALARAFVKKNADLLGLPRAVVVGLDEQPRGIAASDHASVRARFAIRFEAAFPSKGFEGFKEVDNKADLEVFVDDDGEVSSFVNTSRIHPRLTLDTKPLLGQDDPRVLAQLMGRKVFALTDDPDDRDVRSLGRIPLGEVSASDVTHVQLFIHAAPGPYLGWMTYRLAYFVVLTKPDVFFFRYVVDADTGDVLEDSRAPIAPVSDE